MIAPAAAWAQAENGRITGVIKDQTGGAIPGVVVVATNTRTGQTREAVTTREGLFTITNLPASVFSIKASLTGFAATERKDLQLLPGQDLRVDVELRPEGVAEQITVSAGTRTVDLSSARMGTNVIEREVKDLPINGRQLSQLYLQAPGSVNTGTGTFGDIRFSGRAVQQNVIRYDGVEGTAIIDASPGNLNGEIPSPFRLQASLENIQEFRVDSNNFPAEFGTGTGGQISVVSKSGSNFVRGSIFEYYRDDAFDSPNAFDTAGKAKLNQHQFGGSIGLPLVKDRTFLFTSYESYRLDAGITFVEAVPSAAAWARAVPAVAALRPAFLAPDAFLIPGGTNLTDFDIAQLTSTSTVRENAFSLRLDHQLTPNWKIFGRYFVDHGKNDAPEGVTGRVAQIRGKPQNTVISVQGVMAANMFNEFRFGINQANTDVNGVFPVVGGIDLSQSVINLSGSVANTGIAGQGSTSGIAVPGGLLRQNSATNGRGAPYRPYSLSFIDSLTMVSGSHSYKVGGEMRMIRLKTDRLGGTTYTYQNINDFLANRAQTIQYLGDVSEASVFNDGATGQRHAAQEYYIGYAQDEWHVRSNLTVNYGVRYEYYTPLREENDLDVLFDIDNGTLKDPGTSFFKSAKTNFLPRVSTSWAPGSGKTVYRAGFGIFVGPGQTEDQIQPIESDRISSTLSGGTYPVDPQVLRNNFINNPNNRQYQPRAYANEYEIPERVYQYTVSVQREIAGGFVATVGYVGSQGRNLFLRSVANQITEVRTNADPTQNAVVIREFDIINANGSISRPYAEIDYKTTGGKDSYNALQTQLVRRYNSGLTLNAQYTFARSYGNTAGSNEATTVGNLAREIGDFDYDIGWNRFDVRHAFNLSALYTLPIGRDRAIGRDWSGITQALLGGWDVGAIINARSGLPIDLQIVRPDVLYVDGAGNYFSGPAAGRTAVINTPGGGNSRNVRRPDLVPGVDPYLKDGTNWLNPAAFATPEPGTFGNLKRGSIRGPGFKQVDLLIDKRFMFGARNAEFRIEIFNLFNTTNYANPVGTLPSAVGTASNQVQPGDPYTTAAAATFGKITSTVGRTVGLGTSRQVQFGLRFNF